MPTVARAAFLVFVLACACKASEPPTRPEEVCTKACNGRAHQRCTEGECERGCRLSLDRLVEKEGDHVIACVAAATTKRCDDTTWAECAARIGVHADGGPPLPVVKSDREDE